VRKLLLVINIAVLSLAVSGCIRYAGSHRRDTFTGESWHVFTARLIYSSWVTEFDYGTGKPKNDFGPAYFRSRRPSGSADAGSLRIIKREGDDDIFVVFTFSSAEKYTLNSISYVPPRGSTPYKLDRVKPTGETTITAINIYDGEFNGNAIRVFQNPYRYEEKLQGEITSDVLRRFLDSGGVKFRASGENGDIDFLIYNYDLKGLRDWFNKIETH